MNRQQAIEAGARALRAVSARLLGDPSWDHLDEPLRRMYRTRAAAVIDAATPHLVGEPIGWVVVNNAGSPLDHFTSKAQAAAYTVRLNSPDWRSRTGPYRVLALVPVEDQP